MALIEFKNLPDTTTPLNASNLNNNFNDVKLKNGSLIAVGTIVVTTAGSQISANTVTGFSDVNGTKESNIKNFYDNDILSFDAGAFQIKTKGVVGYIKTTMVISGVTGSGCNGIWFRGNKNTLPTGVSPMISSSTLGIISINPSAYTGALNEYNYYVDSNDNLTFYVNPSFSPYGGSFTPGSSGVRCFLNIEVYSKFE